MYSTVPSDDIVEPNKLYLYVFKRKIKFKIKELDNTLNKIGINRQHLNSTVNYDLYAKISSSLCSHKPTLDSSDMIAHSALTSVNGYACISPRW